MLASSARLLPAGAAAGGVVDEAVPAELPSDAWMGSLPPTQLVLLPSSADEDEGAEGQEQPVQKCQEVEAVAAEEPDAAAVPAAEGQQPAEAEAAAEVAEVEAEAAEAAEEQPAAAQAEEQQPEAEAAAAPPAAAAEQEVQVAPAAAPAGLTGEPEQQQEPEQEQPEDGAAAAAADAQESQEGAAAAEAAIEDGSPADVLPTLLPPPSQWPESQLRERVPPTPADGSEPAAEAGEVAALPAEPPLAAAAAAVPDKAREAAAAAFDAAEAEAAAQLAECGQMLLEALAEAAPEDAAAVLAEESGDDGFLGTVAAAAAAAAAGASPAFAPFTQQFAPTQMDADDISGGSFSFPALALPAEPVAGAAAGGGSPAMPDSMPVGAKRPASAAAVLAGVSGLLEEGEELGEPGCSWLGISCNKA
jgi:hypothetical protein